MWTLCALTMEERRPRRPRIRTVGLAVLVFNRSRFRRGFRPAKAERDTSIHEGCSCPPHWVGGAGMGLAWGQSSGATLMSHSGRDRSV